MAAENTGEVVDLRKELMERADSLREDVQELGQIAKDAAQTTLNFMQERMSDYYQGKETEVKRFESTIEDEILKHPYRALIISAGVGLLLGSLWKKR